MPRRPTTAPKGEVRKGSNLSNGRLSVLAILTIGLGWGSMYQRLEFCVAIVKCDTGTGPDVPWPWLHVVAVSLQPYCEYMSLLWREANDPNL